MASENSFRNTMESSQWNKLPRYLEILVLERLPLLDLRRLSFTCKYFHSLLSDPSFAIHHDRHSVGHRTVDFFPDFFQERLNDGVFKSRIWQERRVVIVNWKSQFNLGRSLWRLSTYGDGFTCLEALEAPSLLLVFNPLFPHEHRTLATPAMADCSWGFHTGIAYDRKHRMCKLVLWLATSMQGAFDGRLTSFVYNFEVGTWKKIPQLNIVRPIYYCRRVTQFLLQERFLCWFVSSTVLVFDVEEDSWTESISFPSTLLDIERFMCIAEHKKQLCVITKIYGEDGSMNWELWKFDRKESVWKVAEVIRPPPIPVWKRIYHFHPIRISGDRDLLSLVHRNWSLNECSIWVYDLSHHAWECLCRFKSSGCLEASLFRLSA